MKKLFLFSLALSFVLISCTTDENSSELSQEDQKTVINALFSVSFDGVQKGSNPQGVKQAVKSMEKVANTSYPLDNNFTYTYEDGKGGNIQLIVDTGGYFNYDSSTYAFLGGFIMISIDENIYNFHVSLTNGREAILSTNEAITFSGNFYMNSDYSFDATKTFFNMQGTYMVNGIEYNFTLIGHINSDGTCQSISGVINGKSVSFSY